MRARLALAGLLAVALAAPLGGVARAADGVAPGGPGEPHNWTQGDKDGFGSSTSLESKAWLTLNDGELTEVYYPDLGTPSARSLEFVVSDGGSSSSASATTRLTRCSSSTGAASPTAR